MTGKPMQGAVKMINNDIGIYDPSTQNQS